MPGAKVPGAQYQGSGCRWRPLPGATDPYTSKKLVGPFPGVVITTGSIQGSQGMYEWLAEDLAERGYVVVAFDSLGTGAWQNAVVETQRVGEYR